MTTRCRQVVLAARPKGKPELTDFRLEDTAVPTPVSGQLLLEVQYLSLDPYMRGRMNDGKSYATPLQIGDVMTGEAVAQVLISNHSQYVKGEVVTAHTGWRTHALSDGTGLRKLDPAAAPVTTGLGVLGMPGFRVRRPARDRQTAARRDRGCRRGQRSGRITRRTARAARGRESRRHRRWPEEMRLREGRASLRRRS